MSHTKIPQADLNPRYTDAFGDYNKIDLSSATSYVAQYNTKKDQSNRPSMSPLKDGPQAPPASIKSRAVTQLERNKNAAAGHDPLYRLDKRIKKMQATEVSRDTQYQSVSTLSANNSGTDFKPIP